MLSKIYRPRTGTYLLAASLVLALVGFGYFFSSYAVFGFSLSRWVIALTVIAVWCILLLIANGLYSGERPLWTAIFYVITGFCLVLAALEFVKPGIASIATYFTVNMGDMETFEIAVPQTITGVALYVVSAVLAITASFFRLSVPPAGKVAKADAAADVQTEGGQN